MALGPNLLLFGLIMDMPSWVNVPDWVTRFDYDYNILEWHSVDGRVHTQQVHADEHLVAVAILNDDTNESDPSPVIELQNQVRELRDYVKELRNEIQVLKAEINDIHHAPPGGGKYYVMAKAEFERATAGKIGPALGLDDDE